MLLATAGTALLLLVVVTSVRKARKRLRYESWHLLHLYGYLGVGLAIPHMLWTGADFTVSPAATVSWWAMWGVTVATVVVFRLGLPLATSLRHGIRVSVVERDGQSGVSVRMTGRRIDALKARGGQFFVWRFLDGAGWTRGHPFSLATDPAGGELVIAARFVGDGTQRLAALRPGTRVLIEGPYGTMTADERRGGHLLMIGAVRESRPWSRCSKKPTGPRARRRSSCATAPPPTPCAPTRSTASCGSGACVMRRCPAVAP